MSRRAAVTKADVARAIKAVLEAGCGVTRVEIDPVTGKIIIITGETPSAGIEPSTSGTNEWDEVKT